jgi:hypothetical protein
VAQPFDLGGQRFAVDLKIPQQIGHDTIAGRFA